MKPDPKLSRRPTNVSLGRKGQSHSRPQRRRYPRLVIDANCTTCGRIRSHRDRSMSDLALLHVERTGHIVVLNGTADLPESR